MQFIDYLVVRTPYKPERVSLQTQLLELLLEIGTDILGEGERDSTIAKITQLHNDVHDAITDAFCIKYISYFISQIQNQCVFRSTGAYNDEMQEQLLLDLMQIKTLIIKALDIEESQL